MSARKPPAQRQGKAGTTRDLVALPGGRAGGGPVSAREPSAGWLEETSAAWGALWSGPLAPYFVDSDVGALRRLFGLYDERARCQRELESAGRLTKGSAGQLVMHPLFAAVASLDQRIKDLEDRCGLSPKARLGLGVDLGRAAKSLDEINRRFGDTPGSCEGVSAYGRDDDPRVGRELVGS